MRVEGRTGAADAFEEAFFQAVDELVPHYVGAYSARYQNGAESREAQEMKEKLESFIREKGFSPDIVKAASRLGFCTFALPLVEAGAATTEDFLDTLFAR